jgi:excisionase family DNA binding protein
MTTVVEFERGPTPLAYTVPDACKAAGLGRTTLYELIAAGRLRAMKAGTRTLIEADSLRSYLASLPTLPTRGA